MITQDAIVNLNLLPGDQVEIEWVDARYLSGWHDRQEILSWERDFNKHHSTGFFAFANDENLLFAETWSPPGWELKSAGGINAIPLSAILNIWRLQRAPETVHIATFGIEETSFDEQSLATGMPGYRPADRERVEYREADLPPRAVEAPEPSAKPDPRQIMLSANLIRALTDVGVLPEDVFTAKGSVRLSLDGPAAAIDASLLLPADKLRHALDIVDRAENRPTDQRGRTEDVARLALDWRRAERAYQEALRGDISRGADIELSSRAGEASRALRVALDARIAADAGLQ